MISARHATRILEDAFMYANPICWSLVIQNTSAPILELTEHFTESRTLPTGNRGFKPGPEK
jgi:hypothetical protein